MDNNLLRCSPYINGAWLSTASGTTIKVANPANGALLAEVQACGARESEAAVLAAAGALPNWRHTSAKERGEKLKLFSSLLINSSQELAKILTQEQGKPFPEAEGEVRYAASFLDWFAEEGRRIYGDIIPSESPQKQILVIKEPVGVCAGITPWNFPIAMITRKMGAALAAGCTFICKPASQTPLSALALAALSEKAQLPPGVFNVIPGDSKTVGAVLLQSPLVRKISFTGSTEVGRHLMRQSADTLKRLTLELGGNAPFIVFEDADLRSAVDGAMFQKYRNSGQTCICVNRFLVHEKVATEFTELLCVESQKLRVGNGLDQNIDIGPLISLEAKAKVIELVQDALKHGAKLVLGGLSESNDLFFHPTILSNISQKMRLSQEEVFGPVACIQTFRSEEDAIRLANDTEYGLASYLYTQNLSRAFRVMSALEYGMVGVNDTKISTAQAPFGGVKQSGYGREGGHYGIEEYLNVKYVSLAG